MLRELLTGSQLAPVQARLLGPQAHLVAKLAQGAGIQAVGGLHVLPVEKAVRRVEGQCRRPAELVVQVVAAPGAAQARFQAALLAQRPHVVDLRRRLVGAVDGRLLLAHHRVVDGVGDARGHRVFGPQGRIYGAGRQLPARLPRPGAAVVQRHVGRAERAAGRVGPVGCAGGHQPVVGRGVHLARDEPFGHRLRVEAGLHGQRERLLGREGVIQTQAHRVGSPVADAGAVLAQHQGGVGAAGGLVEGGPEPAPVAAQVVGGKSVDFAPAVVQQQRGVVLVARAQVEARLPVQPVALLFLENDVENAPRPAGVVAGRGVGDDLDALNGAGRNLVQGRARGLAVDKDNHPARPAQADRPVLVHRYGGHVLQHVQGRAAGHGQVLGHVDYLLVEVVAHHGPLGRHHYVLQLGGRRAQAQRAQRQRGRGGREGHGPAPRPVAHGRGPQHVAAQRHRLHAEGAGRAGLRTGYEARIRGPQQHDVGKGNGLVGAYFPQRAAHGPRLRVRRGAEE